MGPDGMHPKMLRKWTDITASPLLVIFERSCLSGYVPEHWKKAIITSVFKKGKKEDSGDYGPVSFTQILGKVMKQLILEAISKPVEDKKVISSQHGFTKVKIIPSQPDGLLWREN